MIYLAFLHLQGLFRVFFSSSGELPALTSSSSKVYRHVDLSLCIEPYRSLSLYHHVHSVLSTTTNAMTSLRRHTASTCCSGNFARALPRTSPLSSTRTGARTYTTSSAAYDEQPGLPQQTDLLDVYRGLVATGRIRYDEDQIRVVMHVRPFPHSPVYFRI